jgi:hypothetical protein
MYRMFIVFFEEFNREFRRSENILPVVVDVFLCDHAVAGNMGFPFSTPNISQGTSKRVTLIGQCESKCAEIEKVTSEFELLIWDSTGRTFWDEVHVVWAFARSEALQCALAVYVLNSN